MTLVSMLALCGCRDDTPQALGTLEYDRITLPAPAAERIVEIKVREGERVVVGQELLRLEPTRTQATTAAAQAEAQRQRAVLSELEAGPRSEAIAQARAQLVIQWLAELLPLTHFLRRIRGVMLRGANLLELWPDVLALAGFSVVMMTLAISRFRKRLD